VVLCAALVLAGCEARTAPTAHNTTPSVPLKKIRVRLDRLHRLLRSNGTVQAVNALTIRVPQIEGQGGNLTLTKLIPTGAEVKQGDLLAEFDRTKQVDNARDAQAKYEDLRHQVEQRVAQHRADAEKRAADLQQAQADLSKAELELRKGPILSEIDRLKNQAKLEDAKAHVASLKRSHHSRDVAEAADLKILELQRDRQKVAWERAQANAEKLVLRAPMTGMVARENTWRNDSFGPAQEGDQIWPGEPLLRIFDPSAMEVQVNVSEPDDAALGEGAQATVRLDAYPELTFQAHFDSASPVATALLDSVVKHFPARFRLAGRVGLYRACSRRGRGLVPPAPGPGSRESAHGTRAQRGIRGHRTVPGRPDGPALGAVDRTGQRARPENRLAGAAGRARESRRSGHSV
jgi:multidrug efflux pump subunit AcrA (membrane-fusion protein)